MWCAAFTKAGLCRGNDFLVNASSAESGTEIRFHFDAHFGDPSSPIETASSSCRLRLDCLRWATAVGVVKVALLYFSTWTSGTGSPVAVRLSRSIPGGEGRDGGSEGRNAEGIGFRTTSAFSIKLGGGTCEISPGRGDLRGEVEVCTGLASTKSLLMFSSSMVSGCSYSSWFGNAYLQQSSMAVIFVKNAWRETEPTYCSIS
jgi:hypothetical protein